jgi:hypothetical protein
LFLRGFKTYNKVIFLTAVTWIWRSQDVRREYGRQLWIYSISRREQPKREVLQLGIP